MADQLTNQEIDRLEELLALPIFKGESMPLDALQGFLCAIVSSPETIPPSVWMPEALGGTVEYESKEQAEEVIALVMKFYNNVAGALYEQEFLDLILYASEDDPTELDYVGWCSGYIYGSQMGETDWFEAAGEGAEWLDETMDIFYLLNGMLKEDALEHGDPWMSPKEEKKAMAEAQEQLPSIVAAIYAFWQERRVPQEPVRRDSAKVGRNDPCPCGSGKKFKQCCGAPQKMH